MTLQEILNQLESMGRPESISSLSYFGITTKKPFGIPTPALKRLALQVKKQAEDRHTLAQELWDTGIYEAQAVAFWIDDPKLVTKKQMDVWARDFDNWATVDGACGYLFCRTAHAYDKAYEWAEKKPEFLKRAGFSLMAYLAVHDKKANDVQLAAFLPVIERNSDDDRNFVRKAVNWALRQIGKRDLNLHKLAIETAERIKLQNTKPARWIAADALRELRGAAVIERLKKKETAG